MLKQRLKGSLFGKRIFHFSDGFDESRRLELDMQASRKAPCPGGRANADADGRDANGIRARGGIYVTLLLRPKLAPVQAPC